MFTGIITATATIKSSRRKAGGIILDITKPTGWKIKPGDSIATNGICLTVARVAGSTYAVELMEETLARTAFAKSIPKEVNLEQSLILSDRLDGHLVLGHVDCVGTIKKVTKKASSTLYFIAYPKKYSRLVAEKGSVAVDGVSLTVVKAMQGEFSVSLVDYSLRHTTLGNRQAGDRVNLEFDILAKYVDKRVDSRF